jgi:predicted dienelactone hydrolase
MLQASDIAAVSHLSSNLIDDSILLQEFSLPHWNRKAASVFSIFIIGLFALMAVPASASMWPEVGFQQIQVPNGADAPLWGGVWYPTRTLATDHTVDLSTQNVALNSPVAGHDLPLVVLSHGGGGSFDDNYDTALALAHAGFVVAAINHNGDDYLDQGKVLQLWNRAAQLRRLISYMLGEWPQHGRLNSDRVGAFGYSNGGFAALVLAGGIPALGRTGPYCTAHAVDDLCRALKQHHINPFDIGRDAPPDAWIHDSRVKAIVAAAPAFGFTFGRAGLKNVHTPVQLWRPEDDRHQPYPGYAQAIRDALPKAPEYHVVAGAGHYDFLPPCSVQLAKLHPEICADPTGFDRAAFHRRFNREVVLFFKEELVRLE